MDDRTYWLSVMQRIAGPVLHNLAAHMLKANMPVESQPGHAGDRAQFTHLEALGRLLCGIAPWLELQELTGDEAALQARYRQLAREAIDAATDPASPDYMNFGQVGRQPVVDAAFLSQALLRAPNALWHALPAHAQSNLIAALESTRAFLPGFNNWLLFAATIEAALKQCGAAWDRMRVDYALRQHEQWYAGDGLYNDGPHFHWDYYNSFVIQPMLLDVLSVVGDEEPAWRDMRVKVLIRARRYAAIQERLISPEGTFPPIGRSLAYRFGALQSLAQMALMHELPNEPEPVTPPQILVPKDSSPIPLLVPRIGTGIAGERGLRIGEAQVRCALTAVIRRMIEAPGTFDAQGWLTIGFCGHQRNLGETYISTGSTYLCAAGLLPLGLPPHDPFWADPPADWTAKKIWNGYDALADHAI